MSADLQWAIIRNNASSLVKRNGLVLTRDSMNLTNVHSFKYWYVAHSLAYFSVSCGIPSSAAI